MYQEGRPGSCLEVCPPQDQIKSENISYFLYFLFFLSLILFYQLLNRFGITFSLETCNLANQNPYSVPDEKAEKDQVKSQVHIVRSGVSGT